MKFFDQFKRQEVAPPRVLPTDVRYALQYKEGRLNKNDIEMLAHSNFENEAFYLKLKSQISNPEKHKELIQKYISGVSATERDAVKFKKVLKDIVLEDENKKEIIDVDGVKLAQISRQGFDLWKEKFKELSGKMSTDSRKVSLLAHAIVLGLDSFVKDFAKTGKDFNILVPSWITDGSEHVGYNISFVDGKPELKWLPKDFDKSNAIVLDDTVNTGKTLDKIKEFWTRNGEKEPDVEAIVTR